MRSAIDLPVSVDPRAPAAFRSVLCAVTPEASALEAVRQAATVASGAALALVDIRSPSERDEANLTVACAIASRHGVEPTVEKIRGAPATPTLLLIASRHDLLVVGAHPRRTVGAAMPRAAVHQSPVPVMIAHPLRPGANVTDRLLVACDGSAEADEALALARVLARRHGSRVTAVAPSPGHGEDAHVIRDLARGTEAVGADAVVLEGASAAPDAIVGAARLVDSTLLLIGSRGLSGVAALSSVSERVAAIAPCSVLVVRPRAEMCHGAI
jgi:nucleotide-binding universal stress UspA family protein